MIRATTKRALGITLAGSVIGAALAFGARPGDAGDAVRAGDDQLVQLAVLVAVLAAAALLAAYLPARRAAGSTR